MNRSNRELWITNVLLCIYREYDISLLHQSSFFLRDKSTVTVSRETRVIHDPRSTVTECHIRDSCLIFVLFTIGSLAES